MSDVRDHRYETRLDRPDQIPLTMILEACSLENAFVRLEPLADRHRKALRRATSDDDAAWPILRRSWAGARFDPEWEWFRSQQAHGAMIPFALLIEDRVRGVTSFVDPDAIERTVEIGATWLHPEERGGFLNPAAKRLMLGHAFDSGARRVQVRVDAENARSRAAVLKLGAVHEGTIRQDKVTWTGRVRDTAVYSILRNEWPAARHRLDDRLNRFVRQKPPRDVPHPAA